MIRQAIVAAACTGLAWAGLGAAPARAEVPLNNPNGLVFDNSGVLWVANFGGNQVIAYAGLQSPPTQGMVLTQDLNGPTRLAVFKGDLYVTNTNSGTVTVYKISTGSEVIAKRITGLSRPLGVGVDTAGNVYVAENGANDVAVYSASGSFRGSVNADSTGTSFQAPGALLIKAGSLFLGLGPTKLPDSAREYAVGSFLQTPLTPSLVLGNGQGISGPGGIAINPGDTRLIVANLYPTDVTRYSLPSGQELSTISSNVTGPEGVARSAEPLGLRRQQPEQQHQRLQRERCLPVLVLRQPRGGRGPGRAAARLPQRAAKTSNTSPSPGAMPSLHAHDAKARRTAGSTQRAPGAVRMRRGTGRSRASDRQSPQCPAAPPSAAQMFPLFGDPGSDRDGKSLLFGKRPSRRTMFCDPAPQQEFSPPRPNFQPIRQAERGGGDPGIQQRRASLHRVRHQAPIQFQQQVVGPPVRHVGGLRRRQTTASGRADSASAAAKPSRHAAGRVRSTSTRSNAPRARMMRPPIHSGRIALRYRP